MIRPLTCISVLLACGSGLYLYQTKHHAQVVDRQIERTVQQITTTRMQTRELAAAWTLLGNPDRLQTLANQYLDIKPVQPSQFVALSDLDSRLPAPRALPPPSAAPEDNEAAATPVTSTSPAASPDGAGPPVPAAPGSGSRAVAAAGMPATPAATSHAVSQASSQATVAQSGGAPDAAPSPANSTAKAPAAAASRPADRKPAETLRPPREVAETRPAPPHAAVSPPVVAELDQPGRPVPQRLAPPPQTGSLLGMAHTAVAPPVPLPVSTERSWSNGN